MREAGLTALGDRRLTLSSSEVESFEVLALDIASQVLEPSRRTTLIPCEPDDQNSVDNECASEFISSVGLHLFRRPLAQDEIEGFKSMARAATNSLGSFYVGLQAALVGMMVSPDFLFRTGFRVSGQDFRFLDWDLGSWIEDLLMMVMVVRFRPRDAFFS